MKEVAVLVTTKHRGVFFGFTDSETLAQPSLRLKRCRCAIRWNTAPKGFLALASEGPNNGSRIGAEALEVLLHDVTSVALCSDAATNAWTSHA